MRQTSVIIFTVFAFILNSCGHSNTELVNVVGTKVFFPKSSFVASKGLSGLANKNDAIILVTELLNDSFDSQVNSLDQSFIERSGGEILDTKEYKLDGNNL